MSPSPRPPIGEAGWFSMAQLASIVAFTKRRPWGLQIDIATDHEELPEVAEIWRGDRTLPLFSITPSATDVVMLVDASGQGSRMITLEAALAHATMQAAGGHAA